MSNSGDRREIVKQNSLRTFSLPHTGGTIPLIPTCNSPGVMPMPDLQDGESVEMQGSGSRPYVLKNVGGVYSCSCPAWRNQSVAIERRTCKHLRKLRGDAAEEERVGGALPASPKATTKKDKPAPPLLLAESWDCATDPAGWWLSEKLDGVRAYWDGKQFLSRQGNLFHAPDWFVAGLPDVPLDGELWLGRKQFQRTVSIVRRQDKSDHWKEIHYVVFDAPRLEKAFEKRLEFVHECVGGARLEHVSAHPHELCKGLDHLRAELARLEGLGGEGLMMRRAGSRYESGRSATLLKVKTFHDAEARVLKHLDGAGKHKGRLGALLVELPDGTTFSVGTGFSDAERLPRRQSAASSPSATRSCPRPACRASRRSSASVPNRHRYRLRKSPRRQGLRHLPGVSSSPTANRISSGRSGSTSPRYPSATAGSAAPAKTT